MSVCLFSIEIQTAGRIIGTKFGAEVVLEGGKVLGGRGGGSAWYQDILVFKFRAALVDIFYRNIL